MYYSDYNQSIKIWWNFSEMDGAPEGYVCFLRTTIFSSTAPFASLPPFSSENFLLIFFRASHHFLSDFSLRQFLSHLALSPRGSLLILFSSSLLAHARTPDLLLLLFYWCVIGNLTLRFPFNT